MGREQNCTVRSCMICTGQLKMVGGELKNSERDKKREIHWRNLKFAKRFSLKTRREEAH